jgi:hypothetical protein
MNIKKDIEENKVVLLVIPNENYNNILINTLKRIMNNDKVCYITLNKGYDALNILFEKNKIKLDNFFFVDCITKTVKQQKNTNDCIFVSSPNSLVGLSLAISKGVKKQNSKFIILDSLSTLLIYHKDNIVSKFVQGLTNKFETTDSNVVFTITKKDKESPLFKNLQMFVNKIIEL